MHSQNNAECLLVDLVAKKDNQRKNAAAFRVIIEMMWWCKPCY